ncbi:SBBP repeat-containing protein [Phormidium tenue FACHB-886]|nr:SBBP repeat-containing protein [Phormidium tenue FACHB-886]
MEDQLFSLQLFTPGSDIAIGFRPSQVIFGRTGNDVVLGYQPTTPNPTQPQIDTLLGDFTIDDPAARQWKDTFILGDWNRPYYANAGVNDFAFIPDFNPALDTIQLNGSADDYQLISTGFGTAIALEKSTGPDVVGFLLGTSDLSLAANYFEFRGTTPPPGPTLPQIKQVGTSEFDIPLSISSDPDGNVYVGGGTNGSLAATNTGLRDNFVTKYDNEGNELFTKQFGTAGFETIYGIDTDNQGNFYVTGITDSELAGPKQADIIDTVVAKFDSNGNQQWIRQIGQNVIFNAFNLDVDPDTGDVFISGADVKNSIENPDDAFIIKFDTNGNQQWQTETGTSGFINFDETYGLTVAEDGSVYATGWTVGDLGGPNEGLYDNWIAKYDNTTGAQQWVKQYGTSDYEWSWDVRTDSQGNVYTTGWTLGDLAGTGNAGSYDAYLTKFDSQGNQQWVKQFGTSGDDEAYSLFIDENDNLFLGGYTDGSLGGTNAGSFDPWLARFDTDGNQQWVKQFGTSDRDELYGLTGDNDGNLFVTGITQGSFGATNAGSFDGWSAKIDAASGDLLDFSGGSTALTATADAATTTANTPIAISVLSNDTVSGDFTLTLVDPPSQGTAEVQDNGTPDNPSDDFIFFTPETNATGTFDFTYQLDNGQGTTSTALVSVSVNPLEPSPETPGLIDLTTIDLDGDGQVDGQVQFTFSNIESEAVFNNSVGLYLVENEDGFVLDSMTGNFLQPGDAGYAAAALQRRLPTLEIDRNTGTLVSQLTGGSLFAPYIVANGTAEQFLTQNASNQQGQGPNAYFAYLGANPDQAVHVKALGNNKFGFEDLWGGGDNDFNDIVFQTVQPQAA